MWSFIKIGPICIIGINRFKLAQWLQRSWLKCEKLTDGRTTDDWRSVVTIAHMTLWVRWAKKQSCEKKGGEIFCRISPKVPYSLSSFNRCTRFWTNVKGQAGLKNKFLLGMVPWKFFLFFISSIYIYLYSRLKVI
jgi:hypothetical protein